MIVLLGASGYIGQAFARHLEQLGQAFAPLSRKQLDYTSYDALAGYLRKTRPRFLINAAGFTGKPNVDACETARADTLLGNTLLPVTISHACQATGTPWGHVSSGCIYSGAKVLRNATLGAEPDLMKPELANLPQTDPETIQGYAETDEPNFSFRSPPCSFYSGTKALAEEALVQDSRVYMWRLRIPFDEQDGPRNYLTKLQRYPKVYDNVNSISHLGDYVQACLALWEREAEFGIYNVTNPGYITTREVVGMIQQVLKVSREFQYWSGDEEFYRVAVKTPRSNCVLDVSKLLATGVTMRPLREALADAMRHWNRAA